MESAPTVWTKRLSRPNKPVSSRVIACLFFLALNHALARSIISSKSTSKIKSKMASRLKFSITVPCIPGAYRISSNIDFQVKSIWYKIDLDHVDFQGLIPIVMENVKKGVIPWTAFFRLRIMIRIIMEKLRRYKVI